MQRFNYLSPDGFPISPKSFKTREAADVYLDKWVKQYERQGYYSSNSGRIPLDALKSACDLITEYAGLFQMHEHVDLTNQAILVSEVGEGPIGVITLPQDLKDPSGHLMAVLGEMFDQHLDADVEWADGDFDYHGRDGEWVGTVAYDWDDEHYEVPVSIRIIPRYS